MYYSGVLKDCHFYVGRLLSSRSSLANEEECGSGRCGGKPGGATQGKGSGSSYARWHAVVFMCLFLLEPIGGCLGSSSTSPNSDLPTKLSFPLYKKVYSRSRKLERRGAETSLSVWYSQLATADSHTRDPPRHSWNYSIPIAREPALIYTYIYVGKQMTPYAVQVDTGSADLLIPSNRCVSCLLMNGKLGYGASSPEKSSQKRRNYSSIAISYADGTHVSGYIAEDVVEVPLLSNASTISSSGSAASNHTAAVTTAIDVITSCHPPGIFSSMGIDGILGLGNDILAVSKQPTLLSRFIKQHQLPDMFGFYVGYTMEQYDGVLTLGGLDSSRYYGNMMFTPLISSTYYAIQALSLAIVPPSTSQSEKHLTSRLQTVQTPTPPTDEEMRWIPFHTPLATDSTGDGGKNVSTRASFNTRKVSPWFGYALIDSGTTLTLLPGSVYDSFRAVFQKQYCHLPLVCSTKEYPFTLFDGQCFYASRLPEGYPSIRWKFFGDVVVNIPPSCYFRKMKQYDRYLFCLGIQPVQFTDTPVTVLGDTFLSSVYVAIDRTQARVGFATPKVRTEAAPKKKSAARKSSSSGHSKGHPVVGLRDGDGDSQHVKSSQNAVVCWDTEPPEQGHLQVLYSWLRSHGYIAVVAFSLLLISTIWIVLFLWSRLSPDIPAYAEERIPLLR